MDQFVAELEGTLRQVVGGSDTATIKASTARLHERFYSKPEVVPALVQLLQSHAEPQLRQIAGVEARKAVAKFWGNADGPTVAADAAAHIRRTLLQSTFAETTPLVRHTSARVIAAIAGIELENKSWPELLPLLVDATRSQAAAEREVAVYILYSILDADAYVLDESAGTVLDVIRNTIHDPESLAVRVSSVQALGKLSELLGAEQKALVEPLVPEIVQVLQQATSAGDDKAAQDLFEVLTEMVYDDAAVLGKHFAELVQHMVSDYAVRADVDAELRVAALQFLYAAVRFRAKKIQSLGYGPTLTEACIQILAQPSEDDDADADDDDDDETTPAQLATVVIGVLSSLLPPSRVLGTVLKLLPTLVKGSDHEAAAGLRALAACIEDAPDYVAQEFESILLLVVEGLSRDAALVKVPGLDSLAMLANELPFLVGPQHETLLPLVFNTMEGAGSKAVARRAAIALDTVLMTLDRKIITEKYLDTLVPRLLSLANGYNDLQLRSAVVTSIGSAAYASGPDFLPFFQNTMQTIQNFIVIPTDGEPLGDDLLKLSGVTVDTIGSLCRAVGRDNFAPYLETMMNLVLTFLAKEISELREASYVFIGTAARVFGESFAPFVSAALPKIFETLALEDFEVPDDVDDEGAVGVNDEEEDLYDGIKIRSGIMDEKEFAADALADIIVAVPESATSGSLAEALDAYAKLLDHFSESLRRTAVVAIWRIAGHYYVQEHGKEWKAGFPAGIQHSEGLTKMLTTAWKQTLDMLYSDETPEMDLSVVSTIIDALTTAIRTCGPGLLPGEAELSNLTSSVFLVLEKQHPSQLDEDDEDDEGEGAGFGAEEATEADEALIELAVDLIAVIAGAVGPSFGLVFPPLANILSKYTASKNPSERAIGVGAFAELVANIKGGVSPYTQDLLTTFVGALDDKKLPVRSVGAYGAGLLARYTETPESVRAAYPAILSKLQGLLKKVDKHDKRRKTGADEEDTHNDRTSLANACGCIARMTLAYPEGVPIDQVLPALFARLPLASAFEENKPIFELIASLVEHKHAVVASQSQELLRVLVAVYDQQREADQEQLHKAAFGETVESQLKDPETRAFANQIVKAVLAMQPDLATTYPSLAAATQ